MIDIEGLQNLCSCLATMALELMTAMTQDLGSQSRPEELPCLVAP